MIKRTAGTKATLALGLATAALFALGGSALGATVTYTSTDVPQNVSENDTDTSTLALPQGLPPATDIDIVGIGLAAASNSADQSLALTNPAGLNRFVVLLGCSSYPGGTNFNLDQQAPGNPFGGAGTCPAGTTGQTYKPSTSAGSATPLTDLLGPTGGTWTMTYDDAGALGSGGTLSSWGLRVTYQPLTLAASGKKQRVKKRVRIKATCNTDCSLAFGGDAKGAPIPLGPNATQKLSVKVKGKALARVEDGGKLKVKLTATNTLGESVKQTVKVKVLG
jgi:hypothetical protein